MTDVSTASTEHLQRQKYAVERQMAINQARTSLMPFIQLMRPHPENVEDAKQSQYEITPQGKLLCEVIEKAFDHKKKYVAVSIGPQLGKSEVLTRMAPAWFMGRRPRGQLMIGTYNQPFANQFGDDINAILSSQAYKQVFPKIDLRVDSKDYMVSTLGGKISLVGVGGSGTGKPADVFIVDDPFKSADDANSESYRERVWKWFTSVVDSRTHNKSVVIVVQCMVGDTRVLLADGTEKHLKDVRVGDRVATFEKGRIGVSRVTNWANQGADCVFTIKTSSGANVTANERHPFLVNRKGRLEWVRLRSLRPGDRMVRAIGGNGAGSPAPPMVAGNPPGPKDFATPTTTSGDGRAASDPHRLIREADVKPTSDTDTESVSPSTRKCSSRKEVNAQSAANPPEKTCGRIGAVNSASIIAMTEGTSEGCCATIATLSSAMEKTSGFCSQPLGTYATTLDDIVEIVAAGRENVFDIQVEGTENFIANGLVSHNTRWHEDDLIGRLCDPDHPERHKKYRGIADDWMYINLPAVVTDPKLATALGLTLEVPTEKRVVEQFGATPMAALWPGRKNLSFLARSRNLDSQVFDALYMGKPSPDDGDFFTAEMLVPYEAADLPKNLRKYGASDHAVTEKQVNDSNVIGCLGVDEHDHIWILPDLAWARMKTDRVVEEIIARMQLHRPNLWWLENELISKSFGPFLLKRMQDTKSYYTMDPVTPTRDKSSRAASIQGRMSMKMVHFPVFAPWWKQARAQLLKFPHGTHDDFVDWMSLIGMGLLKLLPAQHVVEKSAEIIQTGSLKWILAESARKARQEKQDRYRYG